MQKPETTMQVVEAVNKCLSWNDQPESAHRALIEHNREMLKKNASPEIIAQNILNECF
jgi:hypothetical protein